MFIATFLLVFVGELGDKTQIAAGTGTLANKNRVRIIFLSSCLALVSVSGLTVFGAGFIPETALPTIQKAGGLLLILYGSYLFYQATDINERHDSEQEKNSWKLFLSHFSVVFIAELGDKTQIATLAASVANRSYLLTVFAASASALVAVTTITIWGVTLIPPQWMKNVQRVGAVLMVTYGSYMLL